MFLIHDIKYFDLLFHAKNKRCQSGTSLIHERRKSGGIGKGARILQKWQYKVRSSPILNPEYAVPFFTDGIFRIARGERYVPDIRNFTDNQAVKRHCDSLQEKGYTIRKEIVYDIKALHSDYLIRNIDLAFQAWQKPWAKDISFEGFCRYILPYRQKWNRHPIWDRN